MISPKDDPLKSEKLAAFRADVDKLKTRAAQSNTERLRLTKILHPQFTESTVQRFTPKELALKANLYNKPNVSTNPNFATDEAARKADALKRTLAGEPLENSADTKAKLEHEKKQSAAIDDAIEFLTREINRERSALSIQYCNQLKPKEAALMSIICKSMVELHAAWSELYNLKRHLIDSEVGLRNICHTLPDFLGAPNDRQGDFAQFCRDAHKLGFMKSIPAEYRQ